MKDTVSEATGRRYPTRRICETFKVAPSSLYAAPERAEPTAGPPPTRRRPGPKPKLSDAELHDLLWDAVRKLFCKRIVLDFTDHLSDRELYCLIYRDILPSPEKKIDSSSHYLHWDCAGATACGTSNCHSPCR